MLRFGPCVPGRPGGCACAIAVAAGLIFGAHAAKAADGPPEPAATQSRPMNMNEPMPGKMKKEGMKLGDVKRAAEKRDREMKAQMQKESESMSAGTAKK